MQDRRMRGDVGRFLTYSDENKLFLKAIFTCLVYIKTIISLSVDA